MADNQNYYEVLGIEKNAGGEEIKKAYRTLSLKNHPDRNNGSAESTALFQKISQAYDTLSDDQKRRQYDMSLSGGGGMGMPFGQFGQNMPFGQNMHHFSTGEFNPAELFTFFSNNVFGGGGGQNGVNISVNGNGGINIGETIRANFGRMNMNDMRQRLSKPVPIIKNEEISLSKSYTGCTLPIEIVRGIVENGVTREEKETLYLSIPPGIDNNELLILRDKGHIHAENNKGDVKVFIKITNNSEFVRNGLDLILNKTISLKDALCGFSFDMRYIDDRIYKINNGHGNIITHNYKKMIPKMGMKRDEHIGNLIIEFNVIFPEKLSDEQIEGLAKIL
jgi:DnaJ-class molecular chaperone